jgi:hypothetical protein
MSWIHARREERYDVDFSQGDILYDTLRMLPGYREALRVCMWVYR